MKSQSRPFTVTVKRSKRPKSNSIWGDTPQMAQLLSNARASDEPAADAIRKNAAAEHQIAPNLHLRSAIGKSAAASVPRRVLADLTVRETTTAPAEEPPRRRGRPRKHLADTNDVMQDAAPKESFDKAEQAEKADEGLAAVSERCHPAAVSDGGGPSKQETLQSPGGGEANPGTSGTDRTRDRGGRVSPLKRRANRELSTLPRGQRWKRHLPRSKW